MTIGQDSHAANAPPPGYAPPPAYAYPPRIYTRLYYRPYPRRYW